MARTQAGAQAGRSIAAALAPICPTPTDRARLAAIAAYLESAAESRGLDVLAIEFERLNDQSRRCRGERVQ